MYKCVPYSGWNRLCGWEGDTDEHPWVILFSSSYSAPYPKSGWSAKKRFDVWGAVFQRGKIRSLPASWMSATVAVGQHQFLNYVLQNERWGIRFTLKKYMNSPTKSFTSVNKNDWMTCSDFCTCIQSFYSFLFKTARDSHSSACSAIIA